MRDGKTYVMLEGEIEEVIDDGAKLRIDFLDGNDVTLAPPPNTTFYVNGEQTPVDELTRGTELNFYIPEDRFQAEFAGASSTAPFIIVPFELPVASTSASVPTPMTLMLIPATQQRTAQAAMKDGCWATLYGEANFEGNALTLVGPIDMKRMVGPYGFDWDQKLRSIKTGPRAYVTLFDNEAYRDRSAKLDPGASVSQITDKLGLFEEVQSMLVSCNPPV